MNQFTKTKSLLAVAVLGLAVATPAHADLFAYAKTSLTNFVIRDINGDPLDYVADFSEISVTSSADMDGTLTGTPGFSFSDPASQSNIDFPASCVSTTGDCTVLNENTFNNQVFTAAPEALLTGAQGKDYVTGDQVQFNSPLDNAPGFDPAAGAEIGAISVGSLSATTAEGSANTNNGLSGTFELNPTETITAQFTGLTETYLEAFATAGEEAPGSAKANTQFNISIVNNTTGANVYEMLIDDTALYFALNQTAAANPNNSAQIQNCGIYTCGTAGIAPFATQFVTLVAGNEYQISMRLNTNIDINRVAVPEPGMLGLLGMGLLGGVFVRRRRTSSQV